MPQGNTSETFAARLKDQATLTYLLRDASRVIGFDAVKALLPKPFVIWLSSHDTGCQPKIQLAAEGLETVTAWEGSVWYSSCYFFNDRGKQLGLNPDVAFVEPMLAKFFDDVANAKADAETARLIADEEEKQKPKADYSQTVQKYGEMFKAGR